MGGPTLAAAAADLGPWSLEQGHSYPAFVTSSGRKIIPGISYQKQGSSINEEADDHKLKIAMKKLYDFEYQLEKPMNGVLPMRI